MSSVISIDMFTMALFEKLTTISVPSQFVIEGQSQTVVNGLTWGDIFTHIKSEHWHQVFDKCGRCTQSCPHKESLYDHLITCGRICYEKAQSLGYSEKECIKAYLTGLLHDVGKPGTRRLLSKHTAFKGHGLVGGAMIERLWSPELCTAFGLTKEDWGDISVCADVHMCSYFPQQNTMLHKYSVNILPTPIKKMLLVLRTGDQLAMTPNDDFSKTIEDIRSDVDTFEKDYVETLFTDIPFETVGKKKGILILLQGGSASGKSTFAKNLISLLGSDKCCHINRDWYMVHWTRKMTGDNPNITMEEITPDIYKTCHKEYIASDKKWAPQMNTHMQRDIFDGLQRGNVVIVDTLATMFDAIETIIPSIAKDAYRIAFWMHRNDIITEQESKNRLGMEIPAQLGAHGEVSIYNPLHNRINWTKMISSTEGDQDWEMQVHLSLTIGRTDIKNHVVNHLVEKIKEMYAYNQSIPRVPVIDQTYDMTLREVVSKLNELNGIQEFFKQYAYTVSDYVPGVVGIKYIDGMNRIWQPKWAREARGRFYYIGGDKVIPLKDTLQRGIEVLTKAHLDGGIQETQDVDPKSWDILDTNQKTIMRLFSGENTINAYLTGKVDGSLLILNVYPINCEQYPVISKLALDHGDAFTQTIVKHCIEHKLPIVTVSTQGTLFIGSEMQDYFLTAIQPLLGRTFTSMDDWSSAVPVLVETVLKYYERLNYDDSSMVNMCFEAYCKDRITITGKLHTELAVGYDHSGLNLLGLMYQGQYYPHFDLPRYIFKQPFYYNIKNTADAYRLMKELDEVVLAKRKAEEFLTNFTIDELTSTALHPEGFVLLTPFDTDGIKSYDYAKIKTQLYYKCHKVRQESIRELLNLPIECAIHYPILKNLHLFFDNIGESIHKLVNGCYTGLANEIRKDSVFYTKQNSKAQVRFDAVINAGEKCDPKAREVVFKMMLNNRENTSDMLAIFTPITTTLYNSSSEEMMSFTKSLLMRVEPWKPDWEKRLDALFATFDESVNRLYGIVIGFTN
jgi:hypothetical protein